MLKPQNEKLNKTNKITLTVAIAIIIIIIRRIGGKKKKW